MPDSTTSESTVPELAVPDLSVPDLPVPKLARTPEPPDIARCHGVSALSLGLPSTLAVEAKRGRIPKQTFYRHMAASARLKREFVDSVESITMLALIQPGRIGMAVGTKTSEIAVLGVDCRSGKGSGKAPEQVLAAIAQAVAHAAKPARRVLFAVCHDDPAAWDAADAASDFPHDLLAHGAPDHAQPGIGFAQLAVWRDANEAAGLRKGTLRMGRRIPCSRATVTLPADARTMDDVWDSLCAQVILGDADFHAVDHRIAVLDRRHQLQKAADKLRRQIERTSQVARRNKLWDELRAVEKELHAT
ncbi:MAG: DUF4391 domain-containing protein [Bifidobacteriaceae bacterium]|nr:DUF4391 domain-containing protein [Bifidobacteriaceae bacterium]